LPPPRLTGDARPLSAFWRQNASIFEAAELANLLRALRKVAGHLGENVGRIEYAGMSHGDPAAIVVDPVLVSGKYPVPPEKVDGVVGLVVHEALLGIEWTERVYRLLSPRFRGQTGLARVAFQKMVQTGENIFVDRLADRSVLGRYVAKTRGRAMVGMRAGLRSEILTVDALFFLWWLSTWQSSVSALMEPVYEAPMARLSELTRFLETVPDLARGSTARCEVRAAAYAAAWDDLAETLGRLTLLDRRLVWVEDSAVRTVAPGRRITDPPPRGLSFGLAREVEAELALYGSDLTPIIRSVAGEDNPDVAPISRWDFHIPAHPVIDPRTVARLKGIFLRYAERRKLVSRGLAAGRVDGRRLHRAPVTGRCFSQVDRLPVVDWNVTLLLDATGSMRGPKWRMVENTVGNVHRALGGFKNRLSAYAYFEVDGVCMVSRLISGKELLSVPPAGQTASGQAIIAAAWFMRNAPGRKILIHVTDGESNFGCDVSVGIDYCRKSHVHLITLGCGIRDQKALMAQYGKTIQFLQHFGQLPQAMERLFKWTFLYGAKKRPEEHEALAKMLSGK